MRVLLLFFVLLSVFLCGIVSGVNVMIESDTNARVVPGTIMFSGSVSGNETPVTDWSWEFKRVGDPLSATPVLASGETVTVTFTRHGTYRGYLYVTADDQNFQSRPYTVMIYKSDEVPEPDFQATRSTGTAPLTVTFTDTSKNPPTSWYWSFGDGSTGTGQKVTHTYTDPGRYSITLKAENPAGGHTKTWSDYIVVTQAPSAAFFANQTSGKPPLTVAFRDESAGAVADREWDFGDGERSTARHPVHTYTNSGIYSVTLTVHGKDGVSTHTKHNLIIVDERPVPDFTADVQDGGVPLTVRFTDMSGGNPNRWRWDFGDGKESSTRHPTHTYHRPGSYRVGLTVSGPDISGSLVRTGYITVGEKPEAQFTADTTFGTEPLTVRFRDTSTGDPKNWVWEFGDGSSSTERHPSHTYTQEGIYPVSLMVLNAYGSDRLEKTDHITVRTSMSTSADSVMQVSAVESTQKNNMPPLTIAVDVPFVNPIAVFIEYIQFIRVIVGR